MGKRVGKNVGKIIWVSLKALYYLIYRGFVGG